MRTARSALVASMWSRSLVSLVSLVSFVSLAPVLASIAGCDSLVLHEGDAGDAGGDGGDGGALNGCTASDFAANDHTAAGDLRLVAFPESPTPAQYRPPCMRIRTGQTVTWLGDLASHPLTPHGATGGSPIGSVSSGTSAAFTFSTPGVYGFACAHHPAQMLGAIDVVP